MKLLYYLKPSAGIDTLFSYHSGSMDVCSFKKFPDRENSDI